MSSPTPCMHRYRKCAREAPSVFGTRGSLEVRNLGRARPLVSQLSYDYNEKTSAPAQFGINYTIHARHTAWIIACLRYEVVDGYDPGHKCLVTLSPSLTPFQTPTMEAAGNR